MNELETTFPHASSLLDRVSALIAAEVVDSEEEVEQSLWMSVFIAASHVFDTSTSRDQTLQSWFGHSRLPSLDVFAELEEAWQNETLSFTEVGRLYELRMAQFEARRRKDEGSYFTPPELARSLSKKVIGPLLADASNTEEVLGISVCDPACGAGSFAVPVIEIIAQRLQSLSRAPLSAREARVEVILNCVYFTDVNPLTIAILRSILWMHADWDVRIVQRLLLCVRTADALASHIVTPDVMHPLSGDFSWSSAFPRVFDSGGFTAIVGNPPWGSLRPTITSWSRMQDDVVSSDWQDYSQKRNSYAQRLKNDYNYLRQGRGDADVYRYFLERSTQLLSERGRLGLILPAAILRADGASPLRKYLLSRGTFDEVVEYTNSAKVFRIHSMFRFVTLVWSRGRTEGIRRLSLGNSQVSKPAAPGITVSRDYIQRVSGHRLSIPDIRSSEEQALLHKLTNHHPLLEDHDENWNVRFTRELDMTKASDRFIRMLDAKKEGACLCPDGTWIHPREGVLLPVYEGRMVHQHDAFAKEHLSGTGRSAKWSWLGPNSKAISPQYLVRAALLEALELPAEFRAGFCDVTGHANERTVLAAMLPARSVAGNKVPTLRFDRPGESYHFLWVAIANSFLIDWIARRRVATSLNYFQWAQIPFPRLNPQLGIGLELADAARELAVWSQAIKPQEQLRNRALIRARIDAIVADAFELSPRDLVVIFKDFSLLDRGRGQRSGTQTRDAVLHQFVKLKGIEDLSLSDLGLAADGRPDSISARTMDDELNGRIAYIPGELLLTLRQSELFDGHRPAGLFRSA